MWRAERVSVVGKAGRKRYSWIGPSEDRLARSVSKKLISKKNLAIQERRVEIRVNGSRNLHVDQTNGILPVFFEGGGGIYFRRRSSRRY